MDTTDLTEMARKVIWLAEDVSLELRAEIGASADSHTTEEDFIRGTIQYLEEILEDPGEYLDFWNLLEEKDVDTFVSGVRGMRKHLLETLHTPAAQRGPNGW